jgi:hypothetical protein
VSFTASATTSTSPPVSGATIFTSQAPANADATDGGTAYELGTKFRSSKTGQVNAIRYWKAPSETGTHVGRIWSATGTLLASVNFTGETVSGWQEQALSAPLNIQANTTYVVSVNVNSHYVSTLDALATSIVNGDLSTVADGNNGVYGNPGTFPTGSFRNSNYFRDLKFTVVAAPTISKVSGDNQSGATGTTLPNPLVVQVGDASGNPQSGVTVTFAITTGGGTLTPASAVTNASGQASAQLTLGSSAGNVTVIATASGIGSVSFTASATIGQPNSIYIENQKPGTVAWKIADTNQAFDEIVGYASATSVNKGGTLDIKVSLRQAGQFTIDVFRIGYYGGTGGRLITSSGILNGFTQPACRVTDPSTQLIECNWSTSYVLSINNDWTSGIYLAKLTDSGSQKQSYVWFVVRDDVSTADILFQSSFNTYQAYNNAGFTQNSLVGHSLYSYNSGGVPALKVSFDRPFAQTNISYLEYHNLLRWEYNMVRWLESQSYSVTYVTDLDVHINPQMITRHKVFLSVGHDEYWSMEHRNSVEQARDAGVHLAFFSANTAYWRVRFENSSTGISNRVMACYKNDWNLDPLAQQNSVNATNQFRAPQINRPENALLGVMYVADRSDLYGGFDFVIKNSTHPYFANTGLKNGDRLTQLVGFEWDAVVNNGFTPANVEILAESEDTRGAPDTVAPYLPPGTNPKISHAVRYVAPSGAKIFSTGSIQWMWGLDSDGVNPPRADRRVRQIAVNVFADMGVKPLTPANDIIVP